MQGTTGAEMDHTQGQVKDQLQAPTTDIMALIFSDIAFLSQEGKVIVNTLVKALFILQKGKVNEIAKLQDKVSLLQNTANLKNI